MSPAGIWKWLACLPAAALAIGGCRLYEPARYARLSFPPGAVATRVLMVGDSLTYYNDLPGLLQQLSARESPPIDIDKVTTPYTSLKFHWDAGVATQRIRAGRWNFVILQEFSRKPVTDPEETRAYIAKFNDEITRAGAKSILFENWARAGYASDFPQLESTYKQAHDETGAILAPIGAAWQACAAARPDIKLFLDDRHPTDAGTYLAAVVLYDVIYNKKSGNLPLDLQGPKLPIDQVQALRHFADSVTAVK